MKRRSCLLSQLLLSLVFIALTTTCALASPPSRTVALLDLAPRNGESSGSLFSLQQAMEIVGIPYVRTDMVSVAVNHAVIYTTSYLGGSTLTKSEKEALKSFVSGGGILVCTNVTDSYLYGLFGVSGSSKINTRHAVRWAVETADTTLRYFDDPNEVTISLGRATIPNVIYTRGYTLNGALALAGFDDGSAAVTRNSYGLGKAYIIGMSYTDIILRNELNMDYSAQRTYSNGFEPTTDTVMLFLRGIYEAGVPYAVWKHTAPADGKAVLMITHDVDSQSSMDYMGLFADLEAGRGVRATYNITTHYISDALDGDFYTPNIPKLKYLLAKGQAVASHGVGHFPDWHKESVFPVGAPGNSAASYLPYFNGAVTTGGTVYGELEVSKQLLQDELWPMVTTFRSGYLLWNDKQINVLDALGYRYDSSQSANDVLTNFPYLAKYDNKFSGAVSRVYEIPMTISDSGITINNYPDKVANWLNVIAKNAANNAPTVLLIHPNRKYKVTAEKDLLDRLPAGIKVMDMDSFGHYWRKRPGLRFETSVEGDAMTITILDSRAFPLHADVSLYLRSGKNLSEISVRIIDGAPVHFTASDAGGGDLILHGLSSP